MERKEHFSRKRAAILKALQNTSTHPTAEGVYHQLKPDYPDLSLGTIYRNLHFLCEKGQAVSLGVIEGHERFDGETAPHAHLVCASCGAVVDIFENLFEEETLQALSQRAGCQVDSASVTFHGLCPACAGQKGE